MHPCSFVPLPLALAGVLTGAPISIAAQSGAQPNLVLTVFGGAVGGHRLWTVEKQPYCVLGAGGVCSTNQDTLRLSTTIGSSLVLGMAATYFPWPHLGLHAEVSYLGLPVDRSCVGVFYNPDPENRNQQICDDIQAQASDGGAISIFTGVTLRAAPRGAFSPYARGNVGVVNLVRSTIAMNGVFATGAGVQERQVIADPSPRSITPMFGAAAGFTSPLGPGYQFRLEVRDVITSLPRLTGPTNALGIGPTAARYYHHFALTLAFDVVLERKRGRRY